MTTLSRDQRRRKKLEARQQRAIQGKLLHMAMKGKAGPFLAQRQSKPMPPLSRTGERNESCQLPDGTILTARCQVWQNNLYGVAVYDEDHGITHITVQRTDGTPARDWRHLQQIKNEVVGEEREAMEIYPAESRKVDFTNTTHLWVLTEGDSIPFGMVPPPDGITITRMSYEPSKEDHHDSIQQ